MGSKVKFKQSFTLVELLIVVVILGILFAILLPSLHLSRRKAQQVTCLNNTRQIGIGVILQAKDNDRKLPKEDRNIPHNLIDPLMFRGDVFKAMNLPEAVWQCPANPRFGTQTDSSHGSMHDFGIPNINSSYMYLGNGYDNNSASYQVDAERRPQYMSDENAELKTIFADNVIYGGWFPARNMSNTVWDGTWMVNHAKSTQGSMIGANQFYLDGHGAWKTDYPATLDISSPNAAHTSSLGGYWSTSYWW